MKQKQTIKLNESQLNQIIRESIENVLNGENAGETSLEEGFFGNMVQGAKSMYQQGQQINQQQQTQQQLQQYLSQFNKYLQPARQTLVQWQNTLRELSRQNNGVQYAMIDKIQQANDLIGQAWSVLNRPNAN